jgi:hypothetical protein
MSYDTERLIKNARTALPGAVDSVILLELFNVLNEFFQDTNIWQEDIAFTVLGSETSDTVFYIEPESVSSVVRLMSLKDSVGFPINGNMAIPGEVTLVTPPGNAGTYVATVALTINDPTQRDGYPEFPEWILNKYSLGILDGVLGRMMSQPSKPYLNIQLATYHTKKFRNAVSVASAESDHRNVYGRQAWAFPQSFATRRR